MSKKHIENLKKCQLQISVVNRGEFEAIRQIYDTRDINAQVRMTSLYSAPETWKTSYFNADTGTFKQSSNLLYFKRQYTREDLDKFHIQNSLTPNPANEKNFNDWKIITSYVKNFKRIQQTAIDCPSKLSPFKINEYILNPIDQNALTFDFGTALTLKKGYQFVVMGQRGYEVITIDEDKISSTNYKIKRTNPLNFTTDSNILKVPLVTTTRIPPITWTCDIRHYGSGDGCHCECGEFDPDCVNEVGVLLFETNTCPTDHVCTKYGKCIHKLFRNARKADLTMVTSVCPLPLFLIGKQDIIVN